MSKPATANLIGDEAAIHNRRQRLWIPDLSWRSSFGPGKLGRTRWRQSAMTAPENCRRLRTQKRCGKDRRDFSALCTARSIRPPKARCRSSVVEHSLGKGEVLSSILSGSTIKRPYFIGNFSIFAVLSITAVNHSLRRSQIPSASRCPSPYATARSRPPDPYKPKRNLSVWPTPRFNRGDDITHGQAFVLRFFPAR